MADNLQVDDASSTTSGPIGFSRGFRTPNAVLSTSASYTALTTDPYSIIEVTTGATGKTVTLPTTASSSGRTITVSKIDSGAGAVTISPTAGNINGSASFTLSNQYEAVQVYCDGTQWYIVNSYIYAEATLATVFTPNGTGVTASASVNIALTRIGRTVTVYIPAFTCVSTGTSSTSLNSAAFPAVFRPLANTAFAGMTLINNGAQVATPGTVRITTGGLVIVYRDGTFTTAYTNSAGAGLFDGVAVSYSIQ